MNKPQVLQIGEYPEWDQVVLDELFMMHRFFEVDDKEAYLEKHGADIKGVATRGDLAVPRAIIEALPNLEIIAVYGVGYDGVDVEAANEHNVKVTNTPGVLTGDVADFAFGMMLSLSRSMVTGHNWITSGQWETSGVLPLTSRVYGRRAGVLGLGRIGRAIANRCAAFEMEIAYSSTTAKDDVPEDWDFIADPVALAESCDFLFVASTANAATHHIVNRDVMDALGPEGMLINISRAANIDEEALLDALEAKTLGFAALDVFEGEPVVNPRFLALDNVLLQPHHGSGTVQTRKAMGDLVRCNLVAHFEGKPLLTQI